MTQIPPQPRPALDDWPEWLRRLMLERDPGASMCTGVLVGLEARVRLRVLFVFPFGANGK